MSAELLAAIAGGILMFSFAYIPGLNERWGLLDPIKKRLYMGLLILLAAVGVFLLSCSSLAAELGIEITCDQAGAVQMGKLLWVALVTNQALFLISPEAAAVTRTKEAKKLEVEMLSIAHDPHGRG